MTAASLDEPRVLHAVPGRVRVRLPVWAGQRPGTVRNALAGTPGVQRVEASALTGTVLVRFDVAATNQDTILSRLRALEPPATAAQEADPPLRPDRQATSRALVEGHGTTRRMRLAVAGLDRDPRLARAVVARLVAQPGVRGARADPLTGRVLIEFTAHELAIEEVLGTLTGLELPDLPFEDHPGTPLDPRPLVQNTGRLVGAALGLTLVAGRRAAGLDGPLVGTSGPVVAASAIGILEGFPGVRDGLRRILGAHGVDLLFTGAGIVSLTLAGSPFGLALTGAAALRLVTEIRARRAAWRDYEARLGDADMEAPGEAIARTAGERVPLAATVIAGLGSASGIDGLPVPLRPGARVPAGAQLHGGPFVLAPDGDVAFVPEERPAPPRPALYDRYLQAAGPLSLAYAALTALVTRSAPRTFASLLLVNPRPAVIGREAANTGAAARVLRAGVVVVGTRPGRIIRRPDVLLLDGPRALVRGLEIGVALPLAGELDEAGLLARAAGIAVAAGTPWGDVFPLSGHSGATDGAFDGTTATAIMDGVAYTLGPPPPGEPLPRRARVHHRGEYPLLLRVADGGRALGLVTLRPRLAPGVPELVATCARHRVALGVWGAGDPDAAAAVAARAGIPLLDAATGAPAAIRARQATGALVAFLADSAAGAEGFAACDLAIGLTTARDGRFLARADLLAPDLHGVVAIVEAGARRDVVVRDAVALSVVANGIGALWGFRGGPALAQASYATYAAAAGALAVGWARLAGGRPSRSAVAQLVDPRPERWGARSSAEVLEVLGSTAAGLTATEAAARQVAAPATRREHRLLRAVGDQLASPLIGVLAASAGLSLFLGSLADVAIIAATIGTNVAVGAWQERQAGRAAEALARLAAGTARVLRDGTTITVAAATVVPGDVLVLAAGDRIAADARLLEARNLEVDEAALTGESLPVAKAPAAGRDADRIVLEGSDVTVGAGRAVVVAVGGQTRLGATAAALALDETRQSPLGQRLGRLLRQVLPLAAVGGAVVFGSGLLRGRALGPQLAVAASIALAAVPEGLPLLAGMGEAAVARRLGTRGALVRRLSAVEALGRVDVACTDKTGTLTEGRLALTLVADAAEASAAPGALVASDAPGTTSATPSADRAALRQVLLVAGLASPHPEAADAAAHPTDVAVVGGALAAGLGAALRVARGAESPFDPAQAFHATVAADRLNVKGAPEALVPRCTRLRRHGRDIDLDASARVALLARATALSGRGLRVLMVAEGGAATDPADPSGLVAIGFVGISDPLRAGVPAAVARCRAAGIRVVMLTGDHPATARAIATEAGLLVAGGDVLTGDAIADLDGTALATRLERAAVVARITPLDKLRIVESLQGRGHVVAMTGDGVNDAPALRLADVGVAMGRGGTEVARQAAAVVLADDDFGTLVEALVEGRSFWRNIRRALGLLLGGNLGELGLVVGASVLGLASPLVARQILAVNLITDALPALAVALQRPADRNLAGLAREGAAALDAPLRRDVLRRGTATAVPTLGAYLLALGHGGLPQARTVAFASIVATQLAQTLDAGRNEDGLSRGVLAAVGGSAGLLLVALTVPPVRDFLALTAPTPLGWLLVALGALVAVPLGRRLFRPAGEGGAGETAAAAPAGLVST